MAATYSIHPNLVGQWKKHLLESAVKLFEKEARSKDAVEAEHQEGAPYKQIGKLQVENGSKKYKQRCGTESQPQSPNLLMDKVIWLPIQVRATGISHIELSGGHAYPVAGIEYARRRVLCRGDRGSGRLARRAGDLQHRPGTPVHVGLQPLREVHRPAAGRGCLSRGRIH